MREPVTSNTFHKRLGQVMREERVARGLSQEAVAAALGVTFQQITKREHGVNRITAYDLGRYAKLFGVSPTHLLTKAGDDFIAPAIGDRLLLEVAHKLRSVDRKQLQAINTLLASMTEAA